MVQRKEIQSGLEFVEITSAVDTSVVAGGIAGSRPTSARSDSIRPGGAAPANAKQLQVIENENVSLKGQLAQLRSILIRNVKSFVNGGNFIHRNVFFIIIFLNNIKN